MRGRASIPCLVVGVLTAMALGCSSRGARGVAESPAETVAGSWSTKGWDEPIPRPDPDASLRVDHLPPAERLLRPRRPEPVPGRVVGVLRSGPSFSWGNPISTRPERPYRFRAEGYEPHFLYFLHAQGFLGGINPLKDWTVKIPPQDELDPDETIVVDAAMLAPGIANPWDLDDDLHLVELEVNHGRGGMRPHFVATQVRRLDGSQRFVPDVGAIVSRLRERFDATNKAHAAQLDAALDAVRVLRYGDQSFAPSVSEGTVALPTWRGQLGRLEVLVLHRVVATGPRGLASSRTPLDRYPKGAPDYGAEFAVVYQVDVDGALVDERVLPPHPWVSNSLPHVPMPGCEEVVPPTGGRWVATPVRCGRRPPPEPRTPQQKRLLRTLLAGGRVSASLRPRGTIEVEGKRLSAAAVHDVVTRRARHLDKTGCRRVRRGEGINQVTGFEQRDARGRAHFVSKCDDLGISRKFERRHGVSFEKVRLALDRARVDVQGAWGLTHSRRDGDGERIATGALTSAKGTVVAFRWRKGVIRRIPFEEPVDPVDPVADALGPAVCRTAGQAVRSEALARAYPGQSFRHVGWGSQTDAQCCPAQPEHTALIREGTGRSNAEVAVLRSTADYDARRIAVTDVEQAKVVAAALVHLHGDPLHDGVQPGQLLVDLHEGGWRATAYWRNAWTEVILDASGRTRSVRRRCQMPPPRDPSLAP